MNTRVRSIVRAVVFTMCIAFGLSSPLAAQQIHFVLVGDTNGAAIKDGVSENIKQMRALEADIRKQTKIPVVEYSVLDTNFSCSTIRNTAVGISVSSDDVVLFYYSGHGRAAGSPSGFPQFDCKKSGSDQPTDLMGIVDGFRSRSPKPRLVIAIADACNNDFAPGVAAGEPLGTVNFAEAYKHLFLDYSGMIVISAAAPDYPAIYVVNPPGLGGMFTKRFLAILQDQLLTANASVRWEDVVEKAKIPFDIPPTAGKTQQKPQAETYNLTSKTKH